MQFWQSASYNDPAELPVIAQEAEAAGFEGLFVSEHLFVPAIYEPAYLYSQDGRPDFDESTPFPDPWVTIATLAAHTTKLRFCTLVSILPIHHPLEIAKSLTTLALYSGNRFMLGAGAGWMKEEFEVMGVDFESRGRRFNEMIDLMRKVWQGGEVEHHGEFFDVPRMTQSPAPEKPIPIAMGGTSKAALRRTAERGDGWCGAGNTPDEAVDILRKLGELRKAAGRQDESFECIVPLTTPPTTDDYKRIAEHGATASVNYPFVYSAGPDATLQQKIDTMKKFSEHVIAPNRDI